MVAPGVSVVVRRGGCRLPGSGVVDSSTSGDRAVAGAGRQARVGGTGPRPCEYLCNATYAWAQECGAERGQRVGGACKLPGALWLWFVLVVAPAEGDGDRLVGGGSDRYRRGMRQAAVARCSCVTGFTMCWNSLAVALSVCGRYWRCALYGGMPDMAVACGRCSWAGGSANGMHLLDYGASFLSVRPVMFVHDLLVDS